MKLVLKHAYVLILGCLVNSITSIVPKAVYEKDPEGFASQPVGTGPFMLKEVVKGERYVMEAFSDYFRGEAKIGTVISRVIPDNNAALMALESGELDVMQSNQDYSDRKAIEDNPNLEYYTAPQAPKDFKGLERDVERAKELVKEAGYPNGADVTMRIIGASNYSKPAEVVQAQLKEIGINLSIEAMERASWFDICYTGGDYDITIYANPVQVLDVDFGAYPFMHSSERNGGNNYMGIDIPELDELLDKARLSSDEEEREELYRKVCEIVRDESLFVPMYTGERTYAAVKNLKGVYADPMVRYYSYGYSWE